MNKKKARKTQERKDKKLRVYDGSVVALVSLIIRRKHYYDDFTIEIAEALDSLEAMLCIDTTHYTLSDECNNAYSLMSKILKDSNNYKIILELRGLYNTYYSILVEDKVYMFYHRYQDEQRDIRKKLAKPRINTYSPDYIMQHIEPKVKELEKYNLVSQDLKDKIGLTKVLRNIRINQAKVLSFKKRLNKGKVQL